MHTPGTLRLLYDAFAVLRTEAARSLQERGHPRLQLIHVRVLHRMGESGMTLSHIAQHAGVSRQAVTRAARELEGMGFVEIEPDPSDQRALVAALTPSGRDMLEALHENTRVIEAGLRQLLGDSAYRSLRSNLTVIIENADVTS